MRPWRVHNGYSDICQNIGLFDSLFYMKFFIFHFFMKKNFGQHAVTPNYPKFRDRKNPASETTVDS